MEKRALLENLDAAFLVLDEICDGGYVLQLCFRFLTQNVFLSVQIVVIQRFKQSSLTREKNPNRSLVALWLEHALLDFKSRGLVLDLVHNVYTTTSL